MDFDKPHGKTTKHNKATQRPKNSLVLVWFDTACRQQWYHLRRKSLILELVTLPDATTMRSLAPPALRNHEMPKNNQPSQLHAGSKLWHFSLCSVAESPSNLDFCVLRLYLQLSTLTIYYIISLFCPTLHCLLQH